MPEQLVHVKPSKVRVALALAVNPLYWPDLWRRAKINIGQALLPPSMGQDRSAATAWAIRCSIGEDEALERMGLPRVTPLKEAHPQLIERARLIERASAETLGGGGGIELIYSICEGLEAETAVETGVAYGWSSLAILASITSRRGHLFSVDMPHPLLKDRSLTGAVVPGQLRMNWTLVREPDYTGLRKILRSTKQIDFIHYDSDKSYAGRAWAYRALWSSLRPGGILMSDDIADNTAFRDFAAEVKVEPTVVFCDGGGLSGARHVGLLKKS